MLAHFLPFLFWAILSFVRRLSSDLQFRYACFRAFSSLGWRHDSLARRWRSNCGKTSPRLYEFGVVSALKPDIIIPETGTNEFVDDRREVAGSEIDDLVQLLLEPYSVRVIGVCEVIPRAGAQFLKAEAPILNQYLEAFLELRPNVCGYGMWSIAIYYNR